MNRYPQIAARIFDTPLMIHRQKLDVILHVLGPRLDIEAPEVKAELLQAQRKPGGYSVARGVAFLPIHGTLVQRASGLDAMSGLLGYGQIRVMFESALSDQDVSAIVMDIDSPGGEVAGVFDLVDYIYQARGEKRITAIANEAAYSAAYALASAADEVVVPRTGGVGSIGAIATHVDQSAANEGRGVKVTHVIAGDRKADMSPHAPLSDRALAKLQSVVDETYELFIDTVARNRGLAAKDVRAQQADIFIGKAAVTHGLADRVEAADSAVASVISSVQTKGVRMSDENKAAKATAENNGQKEKVEPNVEAPNPQTAKDAVAIIEACEQSGCPELAKEFIGDGLTAEQAKERIVRAGTIKDLCVAAGRGDKAKLYIDQGLSVADVRGKLFDALIEDRKAQAITKDGRLAKVDEEIANRLSPSKSAAPAADSQVIQAAWDAAIAKVSGITPPANSR